MNKFFEHEVWNENAWYLTPDSFPAIVTFISDGNK